MSDDQPTPAAGAHVLVVTQRLRIPLAEVQLSAVRAQGAGGQNVNKSATAIHLRFDIGASSLPPAVKARLRARGDQRISGDGVVVIKAQEHRSQEANRREALERLRALVASCASAPRKRKPTKPTAGSERKRLKKKTQRGRLKQLRNTVDD